MPLVDRPPVLEPPLYSSWSDHEGLGLALNQGLRTPLAALRASVEGLCGELVSVAPRPAAIPGLLQEVGLLEHNVANLVEYSLPIQARPLRCSVEEILQATARSVGPPARERLLIARPTGLGEAGFFFVDGPLLTRTLRRLVENAIEAQAGEILLSMQREPDHVVFGVLNQTRQGIDPEWALQAFRSTKPNRLGLGLALVARDLKALGASFELQNRPGGDVRVRVTVPVAWEPKQGEELAA